MAERMTASGAPPGVSVAVVVFNARSDIAECLDSLLRQQYPPELMEILVIDNDSTDGTQEIVRRFAEADKRIKLIRNPVRGIAGSRQIALEKAVHPLIAFIDADCIAPPHWLIGLVEGFRRWSLKVPHLAAVGGGNVPPQNGRFYQALAIFLDSYLGSHGSVQGRRFLHDRPVPHLPTVNVLYDRLTLLDLGGFDRSLGNIGEDQDMSFRLSDHGKTLIYLAGLEVVHKMRSTLREWLKNMFTYGKGRMRLMIKHPRRIEPILLAPMLLVAALALTPLAVFSPIFLSPLVYFFAILMLSAAAALRRRRPDLLPTLFCLYVGSHLFYGAGEWCGLLHGSKFNRCEAF
ncbi:MAG: glycosyltransferase [candidate division KSB1 bacterium]|nr:glycosyltransferase [candidate division KSB1 bacterium]